MSTVKTIVSSVFVKMDGKGFRMSPKSETRGLMLLGAFTKIAVAEAGLRAVKTVYANHYKGLEFPKTLIDAQIESYNVLSKNKGLFYNGVDPQERKFIRKYKGISPEEHSKYYQTLVDALTPAEPGRLSKKSETVPFKS